eukprot:gb/GFBE01037742.1/.p1 GENE.gb/GFBE01037742.1/~~gb/GFBE01037742.1/.p1  ORF type:complete len:398 (+),score=100.06 gb/GFBE01037742.1/:1-1194(+)
MKSFDAFARPVQEFQVKTAVGGYISIGSICLVITLFVSELRYFLTLETKDEMLVDQNQDQKYLNVVMDVTFPAAPCAMLDINLLDPKKANVMHVAHEIFKTRLSKSGKVLGKRIRDSLLNVAQTPRELAHRVQLERKILTNHSTTHLRCHSCFQSHIDEDDCCTTCSKVREEFVKRGLDERPGYVFGQCMEEAYEKDGPEVGEGCRLQVNLHVRKVPAIIHIGIGRNYRLDLVKLQSESEKQELSQTVDFSHSIHGLSFGEDFPGLVHVLNGREKSNHVPPMSEHYQYDVHVIPTRYQEDGSEEVASHQYSVTEYVKNIDVRNPGHDAAATGIWMTYDFTPFEVRVTRSRKSLWHFLTECCAILGGIFAFSGMLDNFAHQLGRSMENGSRRSGGVLG